jgi:hypothetical protein
MSEITTSFLNPRCSREFNPAEFCRGTEGSNPPDDTMMKWIEATLAERRPNIDRVGVSYMLQGEAGADQNDLSVKTPPRGKDWYYVGPHVMLVLPDSDELALRYLNHDISTSEPYVTALKSSSPLLVIPIARPHQEVRIETNNGN